MIRRGLIIAGVFLFLLALHLALHSIRPTSAPEGGGFFTRTADGRGADWNTNHVAPNR
jgi:hypothetical protein